MGQTRLRQDLIQTKTTSHSGFHLIKNVAFDARLSGFLPFVIDGLSLP